MLANVFMGISVNADDTGIVVAIDSDSREVFIKGITSSRAMLTVFYPDSDGVALSQSNLAGKIVYTGEVNGSYNELITLPESAPYGEYTIKETSKGMVKTATFEYTESSEHTVFEESFDGTMLWSTSEMCTDEGKLVSTSSGICSAYIKGNYDSLPSNATYTIDFSLDYPDKDAWFSFEFRKSDADAERLLVRKERISVYNPDNVGNTEKVLLAYNTLLKNENYKLVVEAFETLIRVSILDDNEQVLAFGSYTTDCVSGGGFGFRTYGLTARVDSISVSETVDNGLNFSKKILALPKSDVKTVSILNVKNTVTYTSSDSSVASVNESTGEINGVSNGTAIITATSGTDTDKLCVVVYSKPQTIALSKKSVTLCEGEMISVSVTSPTENADLSSLIWESSDESVAYDFGMLPNTRTIVAGNAGSAVISVRDSLTGVVANMAVNVIPTEDKGCISAAFELDEVKREINDNVFGIANNFTLEDASSYESEKNLINELGFNMIRSFPPADGVFTDDTYSIANSLGLPNMTVLTFHNQTVDEIVEDVGQIVHSVENNNPVYIEFGNELYDGSAGMSAQQYIEKCMEAYPAVKAVYPQVMIGVPIYYSAFGFDHSWNNVVLAQPDYFDAVTIHNYKTVFNVDGKTQSEMMSFIYAEGRLQQKVIEEMSAIMPDKEIWISEYGFLLQTMFQQKYSSEQNRMQFSKSVGVALTNMEQTMDMLCDGITDMAAYWYLNDAQGFGVMQNGQLLPNYYTLKELSQILSVSDYSYEINPVYCETVEYPLSISNHGYQKMDKIGAWAFGDEANEKYVVFSNRTESDAEVELSGYKLKKVWQYGGNEDILGEYLTYDGISDEVYVPLAFDGELENSVLIDGFSIVVCELQSDDSVIFISSNIETAPSKWDFNKTGGLKITSGTEIDSVSLIADGVSCNAIYTQIAENTYSVKPEDGWEYSTSYKLTVNIDNIQKSYEFTTVDAPEYTRYIHNYSLSNSKYSDWTNVGITTLLGKKWTLTDGVLTKHNDGFYMATLDINNGYKNGYIDFTLDFSEDVSSTGNKYCEIHLRDGFIRVFESGTVCTYFNGKNDKGIGRIADLGADPIDIRVVLKGDEIEVYSKKTTEEFYSYVGKDNNINAVTRKLAFKGEGKYSISDIECYESDAVIENVRLYQHIDNDDVEISSIANGTNKVSITIADDIFEHAVMMALYKNSTLVECQKSDADGNTHSFEFESTDDIDEMKLFVWDSLEKCEPLDKMHFFVKY